MIEASGADVALIERAIAEARLAVSHGDIPVGAIIVNAQGREIAAAHNCRELHKDPTAHAELLAVRHAAAALGSWRLDDCTIAITMEPCPMCAGAIVQSRIGRVVFGAWNDEYGAAGSQWDLLRDRRLNHRPEVVGGVQAEACGTLVREFFANHRKEDVAP
jgi:tRNA(adenine34) deaminase